MALIETHNLEKTYHNESVSTTALANITFEIERGEFVAIMGPSGSGKSTLMHILGLLDRQTDGEYLFNGHNVNLLSDDELSTLRNEEIGFVFQAFNLLPRTSVLENVKLPLAYAQGNHADERAKEILERVNLSHRLQNHPNQLSGGERQRVAIARALINNPSVIFADEPTGNLDSKSGLQIIKMMQELNDKGNTIILVTHDLTTAEYAKRILSIKDGVLVKDEPVRHRRIADHDTELH